MHSHFLPHREARPASAGECIFPLYLLSNMAGPKVGKRALPMCMCRDLSTIGDTVLIAVTKDGVRFSTNGDIGSANVTVRRASCPALPTCGTSLTQSQHVPQDPCCLLVGGPWVGCMCASAAAAAAPGNQKFVLASSAGLSSGMTSTSSCYLHHLCRMMVWLIMQTLLRRVRDSDDHGD